METGSLLLPEIICCCTALSGAHQYFSFMDTDRRFFFFFKRKISRWHLGWKPQKEDGGQEKREGWMGRRKEENDSQPPFYLGQRV